MSDTREEFLGPSRESAAHRSDGRASLLMIVPFGLFLASMRFWGITPGNMSAMHVVVYWLSPLIGLVFIGYGIRGALRGFREAAVARPDSVWYVISDTGVTYPDTAAHNRFMAWSAMERLEAIDGAPPMLRMTGRPPEAKINRSFSLRADLRNAEGAAFGDRMRAWYDEMAAGRSPARVSGGV